MNPDINRQKIALAIGVATLDSILFETERDNLRAQLQAVLKAAEAGKAEPEAPTKKATK